MSFPAFWLTLALDPAMGASSVAEKMLSYFLAVKGTNSIYSLYHLSSFTKFWHINGCSIKEGKRKEEQQKEEKWDRRVKEEITEPLEPNKHVWFLFSTRAFRTINEEGR